MKDGRSVLFGYLPLVLDQLVTAQNYQTESSQMDQQISLFHFYHHFCLISNMFFQEYVIWYVLLYQKENKSKYDSWWCNEDDDVKMSMHYAKAISTHYE